MALAYLSLGSNLGDRAANLRTALDKLNKFGRSVRVSSFYETEPVELREQPWFVNCVAELETELTPHQLLAQIQRIEQALGRQRRIPKGPRTLDIDIVLFGDLVVQDVALQIPHPAMHQRRFVLEPLTEVNPDVFHPLLQKTARELLAGLPPEGGKISPVSQSK